MNLPKYVRDFFATKFTAAECETIDTHWDESQQVDLSEATDRELLRAAREVLSLNS